MADAPFKKGDVVALKSGSPALTVEDINAYSGNQGWQVQGIWFADPEFSRVTVDADSLELVEDEDD